MAKNLNASHPTLESNGPTQNALVNLFKLSTSTRLVRCSSCNFVSELVIASSLFELLLFERRGFGRGLISSRTSGVGVLKGK